MQNAQWMEVLRRVYTPQLEQGLELQLQAALKDLPSVSLDKVQIYQGRCLAMQDFLAELRVAAGVTANRTAKPNF
jgi:hypothetical protein